MLVDRSAQVVHHALPDLVREQRLHDAERSGDDGDRDHARDEHVEEAEITVGERHVEHLPDQERRDRAEHGREDDQPENGRETPAVRPEEAHDPAQMVAANRRIGGPFNRFEALEGASTWHPSQSTDRLSKRGDPLLELAREVARGGHGRPTADRDLQRLADKDADARKSDAAA